MPRYITAAQYNNLMSIPRSKMSVRTKMFAGVIVEEKGKILLVRDALGEFPGFDFPGGKVLWSEEIKDCAVREFKEETGYDVVLEHLLGIYQRKTTMEEDDYIRFIFVGKLKKSKKLKVTDPNITGELWIDLEAVSKNQLRLKSPQTLREIHDYQKAQRFPLSVVDTYIW